uniref:Uncharacterized protein n=1 Tax=Octopus bimaculoides TaxID=37653 RepID=A0A0L8GA94_OCTBM
MSTYVRAPSHPCPHAHTSGLIAKSKCINIFYTYPTKSPSSLYLLAADTVLVAGGGGVSEDNILSLPSTMLW